MPLVYPTCHPRAEGKEQGYESSNLVHICPLHELIHLRALVMQGDGVLYPGMFAALSMPLRWSKEERKPTSEHSASAGVIILISLSYASSIHPPWWHRSHSAL